MAEPTQQVVAGILVQEPGEHIALNLEGVAVGYDEDGRLVTVAGAVERMNDKRRNRIAKELEAVAAAIREGRVGVVH